MLIKNARVFLPPGGFTTADVRFEERIEAVGRLPGSGFDADGAYLIPGLVDIHTHGAFNADFSDGTPEALHTMARFFLSRGITSFAGTTMALPEDTLLSIIHNARDFERGKMEARLLGIHFEGPFISKEKRGAHDARYIRGADLGLFERLHAAAGESMLFLDTAPELPGAQAFIAGAAKHCRVSLGHCMAGYDNACAAFDWGATHVTHMFNAMPPYLHRAPGPVGAAYDKGAFVEIIADGVHLHESVVRGVFSMFPANKIVLISDSMRAAGLPGGTYDLGGQAVTVRDGKAALADGTIAGSCITLMDAVRNCVRFSIPLAHAVAAATCNAAASAGRPLLVGSIEPGYHADMLLLDEELNILQTYMGGILCK